MHPIAIETSNADDPHESIRKRELLDMTGSGLPDCTRRAIEQIGDLGIENASTMAAREQLTPDNPCEIVSSDPRSCSRHVTDMLLRAEYRGARHGTSIAFRRSLRTDLLEHRR
jgi:hypothetical protein